MTRPDLDAIRKCLLDPSLSASAFNSIMLILEHSEELERRTTYTVGETEWAHRIATLEHMLSEERENVDTLRARVAELEAEAATLRHRDALLKRVDDALAEAGCVEPLSFDGTIESAIKDLARRATRAEQLFVDEYDARRDVERQRDELQARIAVLEAMR